MRKSRGFLFVVLSMLTVVLLSCAPAAPPPTAPTAAPPAAKATAASPGAAPSPAAPAATPAPPPTAAAPRKTKAMWTAPTAGMVSMWVAADAGIFKKHGLDVEITSAASGQPAVPALLSGEVDFLQVDGFVSATCAIEGGECVVVGTTYNKLIFWLFGRPDITSPAQLKGQQVGVTALRGSTEFAASVALKSLGLDPTKDTSYAAVGTITAMVPAIESGRIAAGILSYPTSETARQKGFRQLVDIGALAGDVAFTGLTTSRKMITSRPDVVKDFVAAEIEAGAYMLANKQETMNVIGKYLKVTDPEVLATTYQIYVSQYLSRNLMPTVEGEKNVLDLLAPSVPKAASFSAAQLYDDRFVKQLVSEGFVDKTYAQYGQKP